MQLKEFLLLKGPFDEQKVGDGPIEDKALATEDIVNLLASDDDEDEDDDKDEKDDENDEDIIGDKKDDKELQLDDDEEEDKDKKKGKKGEEDEEEDEEIDEKELDLVAPHKKKEILAAFPGLDKKFPFVFQAYYGYQQYTEVFPTVEDAKEAQEASEAFGRFEKSVMRGSTEDVLKAVKQDENAFHKLVDDYLPALHRVDPQAAGIIISNVYKNAVISALQTAKENNDEELEQAATKFFQYLFPNSKLTGPVKLSKDDPKETKAVSEERRQYTMERFTDVQTDLQGRVDNVVMSTIKSNIDPKKSMSDFERNAASDMAFQLAEKAMLSDRVFKGQLDRLWKAVLQTNFSKSAVENVRRTYLGKARTVLKAAIRQARNEALKGKGRKISSDTDDTDRKGHLPPARHSSGERRKEDRIDNKGGKKPGQTTYDYFSS